MDQHNSPVEEHLHLELLFLPNKGGDAKKCIFCLLFCVSDLSQCTQPAVGVWLLFE